MLRLSNNFDTIVRIYSYNSQHSSLNNYVLIFRCGGTVFSFLMDPDGLKNIRVNEWTSECFGI